MFYKKNPDVEGVIGVQGVSFDNDTVVEGEEFAIWADPATIPGQPPSLVAVSAEQLTPEQAESLQYYRSHKKPKPPKHLGPVTTKNFKNTDDGAQLLITTSTIESDVPIPDPLVDDTEEEKKRKEEEERLRKEEEEKTALQKIREEEEKKTTGNVDGINLSNFSNTELAKEIPGVTIKNVATVVEKFQTLEKLCKASNAELRTAGVKATMFKKLRDASRKLLNSVQEK